MVVSFYRNDPARPLVGTNIRERGDMTPPTPPFLMGMEKREGRDGGFGERGEMKGGGWGLGVKLRGYIYGE